MFSFLSYQVAFLPSIYHLSLTTQEGKDMMRFKILQAYKESYNKERQLMARRRQVIEERKVELESNAVQRVSGGGVVVVMVMWFGGCRDDVVWLLLWWCGVVVFTVRCFRMTFVV